MLLLLPVPTPQSPPITLATPPWSLEPVPDPWQYQSRRRRRAVAQMPFSFQQLPVIPDPARTSLIADFDDLTSNPWSRLRKLQAARALIPISEFFPEGGAPLAQRDGYYEVVFCEDPLTVYGILDHNPAVFAVRGIQPYNAQVLRGWGFTVVGGVIVGSGDLRQFGAMSNPVTTLLGSDGTPLSSTTNYNLVADGDMSIYTTPTGIQGPLASSVRASDGDIADNQVAPNSWTRNYYSTAEGTIWRDNSATYGLTSSQYCLIMQSAAAAGKYFSAVSDAFPVVAGQAYTFMADVSPGDGSTSGGSWTILVDWFAAGATDFSHSNASSTDIIQSTTTSGVVTTYISTLNAPAGAGYARIYFQKIEAGSTWILAFTNVRCFQAQQDYSLMAPALQTAVHSSGVVWGVGTSRTTVGSEPGGEIYNSPGDYSLTGIMVLDFDVGVYEVNIIFQFGVDSATAGYSYSILFFQHTLSTVTPTSIAGSIVPELNFGAVPDKYTVTWTATCDCGTTDGLYLACSAILSMPEPGATLVINSDDYVWSFEATRIS